MRSKLGCSSRIVSPRKIAPARAYLHPRVLHVYAAPLAPQGRGVICFGAQSVACTLGRAGVQCAKREGDGATPAAILRPLHLFWRADRRLPPRTLLPKTPLRAQDGWCDGVGDRNYNRKIRLPYPASHEEMTRPDGVYDVGIVLDWNTRPRIQGRGSAIFWHLTRPTFAPTAGCIAIAPRFVATLIPLLTRHTRILVAGAKRYKRRSPPFSAAPHGHKRPA